MAHHFPVNHCHAVESANKHYGQGKVTNTAGFTSGVHKTVQINEVCPDGELLCGAGVCAARCSNCVVHVVGAASVLRVVSALGRSWAILAAVSG
eukprot:50240-Pelagomonas_calceolata.AAC.5